MLTIETKGIASYAPDRFGASGILAALAACKATPGHVERFAVADHPNEGGTVRRLVTVGYAHIYDAGWRFRYCGEGDKPDGAGSCTLGNYLGDVNDAAVALALDIGRYGLGVYRLGDSASVVESSDVGTVTP